MKRLFTHAICMVSLIIICNKVKAQSTDKIYLSLGPEFGIPVNTVSDPYYNTRGIYKDGFGGSFKLELPVLPQLHVTITAGYMSFKAATRYVAYPGAAPGPYLLGGIATINGPPYEYIPLKAGLRYYMVRHFYIEGEAGDAIKANSVTTSQFIYAGGLGGIIPIQKRSSIDIGVRFERGFKSVDYNYSMGEVDFRVAYRYQFK